MAYEKITHLFTNSVDEQIKLKNMRAEIEREKVTQQFTRLQMERSMREELKIDPEKAYKAGSLTDQNQRFQQIIAKKLPFINNTLSNIICVAAGVVYLVGATTGGGKSTTVANLIIPMMEENKKILVVSNEEPRNHVYARVACRVLGLSFKRWTSGQLSPAAMEEINRECERLANVVTVIGTDFQNNPKFVTTPEGLELIFRTFGADHEVILLDYFQNISHSTENPDSNVWVHQERFCYFLNGFKNTFDGPIIVMSQLWPDKKKATMDFVERIKGRKAIGDVAGLHLEVRPNKEDYTSLFLIHKDRLWNNEGFNMNMGFDRETGRFVFAGDAFKAKAAAWMAERLAKLEKDPDAQQAAEAQAIGQAITELATENEEEFASDAGSDNVNIDGMFQGS